MRRRLICAAGLLAMAAPLMAAKKPEFARAPYAGGYEPQGVDERGLWMQLDEAERTMRDAPAVVRDSALNEEVRSVLCRTVGFDRCQSTRLYIVKDDSFNASMAPNGIMVVHSGLLVRMHSEAELASVLGHEFAHFELRHSLNGFRNARKTTDALAWISLAGAAANVDTSLSQNLLIASHFSFSRAQETAADLLGAAYIRSSPFNLRASPVWTRVMEETDALREERRLRKVRYLSPSLGDTHPTDLQRIAYFTKLEVEAVTAGEEGEDGVELLRETTRPLLSSMFEGLVKGNRFAAADYVIRSRGDAMGWDGQLLNIRAELYRLRANPRDLVTARQFFEKATTYPDAPPESWRGLGLTALRLGETETGRAALSEYLKRAPEAKDASAMKLLLEN